MLSRAALCVLLLGFALPGAALAESTEAERMARWSDLRHAIFGDRVVEDAGDLVAIDAPARAEDAAIVPVAIRVAPTLAPEIRSWPDDRGGKGTKLLEPGARFQGRLAVNRLANCPKRQVAGLGHRV